MEDEDPYVYGSPALSDDTPPKHTQFLDLTKGGGGGDNKAKAPVPPKKTGVGRGPGKAGAGIRVVEHGQEQTGRWTKEEHEAFLSGLTMYGKEWKKVAARVKTRTVVQTRTHAQKYFQKLAKVMEGQGGGDDMNSSNHVDMSTSKKASLRKKKQPPTIALPKMLHRQSSVTSAAHLISNLSGGVPEAPQPFGRPQMGAPNQQLRTPQAPVVPAPKNHGFSTVNDPAQLAYPNTFSSPVKRSTNSFSMKITAPAHDSAFKRGKFPEPSPAATGKRKLAEIAAARMLAGVAASGSSDGKPLLSAAIGSDIDGTATPPPVDTKGKKLDMESVPTAPFMASEHSGPQGNKSAGLSLQIVNPETLGVTYDTKRRRSDGDSPVTPWEGQLQQLVSESKHQEAPPSLDALNVPSMHSHDHGDFAHKVCGPGSAYGRSALHKAVCEMDLGTIQGELQSHALEKLQKRDEAGFCALHSACALGMQDPANSSFAVDILKALLQAGANIAILDKEGNTPLHWAARAGDRAVVETLMLRNSPPDTRNEMGETPLHWAMRTGRTGLEVVKVLLDSGARASISSKSFRRPIDVAADGFHDQEGSVMELKQLQSQRKRLSKEQRAVLRQAKEEQKEARANFLQHSAHSRTLVLHHPECLEHIPKSSSDWEAPSRVTSMLERLVAPGDEGSQPVLQHEVTLSQEFERAKLDLLSRVHSAEYLNFVNELSKDLERQKKSEDGETEEQEESGNPRKAPVVPFTPMVQRSMIKVSESSVKLGIHSDTSFSAGSLRAARRAAGAVQHAVDCVLVGRQRNAFCIVRPPGHHAGINGLLDGGESCGFCIFNNVAAGAMHAISDERLLCERCAIVDIDVHHGNGTEEIVRKCHDPSKLFFFSIHLYDNDRKGKKETKSFQYKFYPGTGDEDDVALNIINVPLKPMWKDKEPSLQQSTVGATHNTRHRSKRKPSGGSSQQEYDSSEAGSQDSDSGSVKATSTSRSVSPVPPTSSTSNGFISSGRTAYRQAIQSRLLPALRAFNPDLILISAGFDASKNDVGNAKHEAGGKEKMGIDLEPEDYAWTTRKICEIADICCQGRVVSVLEGGYGRTPSVASGEDHPPLDKSVLSECAVRHLHALVDPYNVEGRLSS